MTPEQIKNSYTEAVLFECDISDTIPSWMAIRYALEKAVAAGVTLEGSNLEGAYLAHTNLAHTNLARANLARANLEGSNLARANLAHANLEGANLARTYLDGANLVRANLAHANLEGANLYGANLSGACLSGAQVYCDTLLIGKRPYFAIGPMGSRHAMLQLWLTNKGPHVTTGCFTGALDEFSAAVEKTHGETDHGNEYRMAILMMEAHAEIWSKV